MTTLATSDALLRLLHPQDPPDPAPELPYQVATTPAAQSQTLDDMLAALSAGSSMPQIAGAGGPQTGGAGGGGGGTVNPSSVGGHGPNHWENVAQQLYAQRYGWTGPQWRAIDTIVNAESGWNPHAANPTSSARGIPQAMMSAHFGANWQHNPAAQKFLHDPMVQLQWLARYIKQRYGSPVDALHYRQSHGYY